MNDILRAILPIICVALIGALVALYFLRKSTVAPIFRGFTDVLAADVKALNDPANIGRDAFSILEHRLTIHYRGFILAYNAADWITKFRLGNAWAEYYGEGGEQEWYLPNEYSTLLSNQLKNTHENTKRLAVRRLNVLIKLCS